MAELRYRLHELYSVSERILNVHSEIALQRFVVNDCVSVSAKGVREFVETLYEESRVGLASGTEGILDSEVNLEGTALEPYATARC